MGYIAVAVEVDPATIHAEQIQVLQTRVPGLTVDTGHVLSFLLDADSIQHAENLELFTEVTERIYEHYGTKVLRVQYVTATQATGTVTIVAADLDGHTVGTDVEITLARPDGEREAFTVRTAAEIPAGEAAATVEIIAVDPGSQATGLQADPRLESQQAWVQSVMVDAPTVGGADEETEEEYRDRLADRSVLLADTLVIATDYEVDARTNIEGVHRALALDEYDPATGPEPGDNPGHLTVAVITDQGLDPGPAARAAGEARQQENSVAGGVVHWITATYTPIPVVFAAVCHPDFDPADVQARVVAAIQGLLSPATWGAPRYGDQPLWHDKPVVRVRDVIAAIENVDGVDYTVEPAGTASTTSGSPNLTAVTPTAGWADGMAVTGPGIPAGTRIVSGAGTVTMVLSQNATATAAGVQVRGAAVTVNDGTADVPLPGPAGLPTAGTVTGTVLLPPLGG